MMVPIDSNVMTSYVTHESANWCGFEKRIRQWRWYWQFQSIQFAPGTLPCSRCALKNRKTPRSGFDLSALAAGECHPLGQSSGTEIGIYIGNCPRCLPGQFENSRGSRDCARAKRIRRSQITLE